MKRDAQAGFTLLELLVGMAIMAVVLMALLNYFSQGTRVSTQSSSRSELQQEILNAQQLIAGKLKEAWYVYPPLSSSTASLSLGTTELTRNPVSGNNDWKTATSVTPNQPLLAMILPPTTTGGTYRFIAYYPVKRSVWLAGTTATSWRNPGPDDANGETWILAEYRASMPSTFSASTFPPPSLPAIPTGSTPNILSDYIAPTIATTGFTTSANTYTMFTYAQDSAGTVQGVTINLATTRKVGGTTLRLPNATDEYGITVYPTNLGKIAAN